jgi:hypothetical protein
MGKNPAFQFYPNDWTRDLAHHPDEIQAGWMLVLCSLWWSETPGEATMSLGEWSKILRKTGKKTIKFIQYLLNKNIASGTLLDNQNITIISRRMVKDWKISQLRREVGKLGGNPKLVNKPQDLDNQTDNQKPTPSSPSSSSKKKEYSDEFVFFYKAYPKKVAPDAAWKAWLKRNGDRPPLEKIIKVLEWQKTNEWKNTEKKYIPHPATWINSGRWNDEIPEKKDW